MKVETSAVSINNAVQNFLRALRLTTGEHPSGGRVVEGPVKATMLSEETERLLACVSVIGTDIGHAFGRVMTGPRAGKKPRRSRRKGAIYAMEPGEAFVVQIPYGGTGADVRVLAALGNILSVAAFPARLLTDEHNIVRPNARTQRWHAGDVVSARAVELLDQVPLVLKGHIPGTEQWLRSIDCAQMLMELLEPTSLGACKTEISRAARKGELRNNLLKGKALRIDPVSFHAYRLAKRKAHLDSLH